MRRRRPTAFSLLEIVVALAILSILAAATLPSIKSAIDRAYVAETVTRLEAIRDGIFDPNKSGNAFFQEVGAYPGLLSELSQRIVSQNAAASPNSCGKSFSNGQRNKWDAAGPFVKYAVEPGLGLATPIGRINDLLVRDPPNASAGDLKLIIPEAELDLVIRLDQEMNGGDGSSAGSVQWTTPIGNVTTMSYIIPVGNKC